MGLNRNRFFMIGTLLVMLGIQFRMVESFTLNEETTQALIKMRDRSAVAANDSAITNYIQDLAMPKPTKTVEPPRWIGLALAAVGSVLSLHAIAMPKK